MLVRPAIREVRPIINQTKNQTTNRTPDKRMLTSTQWAFRFCIRLTSVLIFTEPFRLVILRDPDLVKFHSLSYGQATWRCACVLFCEGAIAKTGRTVFFVCLVDSLHQIVPLFR